MNGTWNDRFCDLAAHISKWSKDTSTKVGCVLVDPESKVVVATGFNGFPRRIEEHASERWARPTKYMFSEHAERNVIYNAARSGHSTEGCWAYLNWNPATTVCPDCARAFIQAGIVRIIGPNRESHIKEDDSGWRDNCKTAREMLFEAGVEIGVLA